MPLTFHRANQRLMCHYCGYSERLKDQCPACGGDRIRLDGAGTQKVEDQLAALFPRASVVRMDADTTAGKQGHEAALGKIYKGSGDILVGTQMVTKGLDFDRVTLVGVLDADQSLFSGDFRAAERTFDLITQVVGRAGRRERQGRAVIQTRNPDSPVLKLAAGQDYEGFFDREILMREALRMPPFCDFVNFMLSGAEETRVLKSGLRLVGRLSALMRGQFQALRSDVLGPVTAPVPKINGNFRYHVTFRCQNGPELRLLVSGVLREFLADPQNRGVRIAAHMNSYGD